MVVIVGTRGFIAGIGVGDISRNGIGNVPLAGVRGLRNFAIDFQSMAVVHQHMSR